MRTYDPMDSIVYVHVDTRDVDRRPSVGGTDVLHRLPGGYANGSPRTYLRSPRRTRSAA